VPVLPDVVPAGEIVLRRRSLADVPELLEAIDASIAEVSAFHRWAAHGTPPRAELEETIRARVADFEAGTGFDYVLREASTGRVVGEIGGGLETERLMEIGYWVRSDSTGRGYATEAARAATTAVFEHLPHVESVEIRMDKGNPRSRAIAVRLGFEHTGDKIYDGERLSGQTGEGHIYAMARAEWSPV
jgi:RimJ/RimL family protein N-acetyltransferase